MVSRMVKFAFTSQCSSSGGNEQTVFSCESDIALFTSILLKDFLPVAISYLMMKLSKPNRELSVSQWLNVTHTS